MGVGQGLHWGCKFSVGVENRAGGSTWNRFRARAGAMADDEAWAEGGAGTLALGRDRGRVKRMGWGWSRGWR